MVAVQVRESPLLQTSGEVIAWDFDWHDRLDGQTIMSAEAFVIQVNNGADESATCLGFDPTIFGEVITVIVQSLTPMKHYRVITRATLSGGSVQDADLLLEVPY